MTSMQPAGTADPRQSFDDPLLDGLLILCKLQRLAIGHRRQGSL